MCGAEGAVPEADPAIEEEAEVGVVAAAGGEGSDKKIGCELSIGSILLCCSSVVLTNPLYSLDCTPLKLMSPP